MSKGSTPRKVNLAAYKSNHERIFARSEQPPLGLVTFTGGPSENHDPGLLAAKRVTAVNYCQDVRMAETWNEVDIRRQTVGPPVCWLTAQDGTKVVLWREDLVKLVEHFSSLSASPNPPSEPSAPEGKTFFGYARKGVYRDAPEPDAKPPTDLPHPGFDSKTVTRDAT